MKKIVSIILALVMCFFAVAALASCGESAYDIAVKNGFKGTEEQWLQSLKGDAGKDGENAVAPSIEISKDGYWVINGVKTDVKAAGDNGDKGSEGADGREVEFRKGATHIQWRYKGEADSAWKDLISIKELQGVAGSNGTNGTDGEDGKDGREVVFRTGATHIQWKYKNEADTEWKDLVAISTLKGADGKDSRDVQFRVGETCLQWKYATEPDTDWKDLVALTELKGADGREVEFNVDAEKQLLQWRYKGDEAWTDLSELSIFNGADGADGKSAYEVAVENGFKGTEAEWLDSLKGNQGEKGEQGEAGADGREVEVFVSGGEIRWRYVGEKGSYPLIKVWDLVGNGIVSIDKIDTSADGLIDTYQITYTKGEPTKYQVHHGNGIDRIEHQYTEKAENGVTIDHYRIWYTDGGYFDYTVTNGREGVDGKPAREVEFQMNGPQLQWRYTTDEDGKTYGPNEGWQNLYNFGVQLEKTDFVLWLDENGDIIGETPVLTIVDGGQTKPATDVEGAYDLTTPGEYTIVVKDGGKSSEYTITVTTLQLEDTDFAIWNGSEAELSIIVNGDTSNPLLVTLDMITGNYNPAAAGTYDITVTHLGAPIDATVTISTHALAQEEFEIWTHWSDFPELEVIRTNPDLTTTPLSSASMSVDGEYSLEEAGTYDVTVEYLMVSGEYNATIKVTSYAVNKTQFWYTAERSELQLIVNTPDGQSLPNDYMGDEITWGTPGIYPIKLSVGNLPEETINIELQNMIYYEDFNGITATDKAGILAQLGWKDNINYFENGQPTDKSVGTAVTNGKGFAYAAKWANTGLSTNLALVSIDGGKLKIDNKTNNPNGATSNFKLTEDGYMAKDLIGPDATYTIQYDVTFGDDCDNYMWVGAMPSYSVHGTRPLVQGYQARIYAHGYANALVSMFRSKKYQWINNYDTTNLTPVTLNSKTHTTAWGGDGNRRIMSELFGESSTTATLAGKTVSFRVQYIYHPAEDETYTTTNYTHQSFYEMIVYVKKPGDASFTEHLRTKFHARGYLGAVGKESGGYTNALSLTLGGWAGAVSGASGNINIADINNYTQNPIDGTLVYEDRTAAGTVWIDNFAVWVGTGDMPECTNDSVYKNAD